MQKIAEIEYLDLEKGNYENIIEKVIDKCFETEKLMDKNIYISITLTNPENIKEINKRYRQIDKATDVLSFPMFEKNEINKIKQKDFKFEVCEVLGDIIINIKKVEEQAKEYEHSFERELAYMIVHGFYHLMGYDHMEENDKKEMREKEENVLSLLNITRE